MLLAPASRRIMAALLLAFALLVPSWSSLEEAGQPMDEGTLLVYPEQIMHGKLPYRDFESFYGPANIYVLTGVYQVFGVHVTVERSVGLAYRFLIFLAVFALAQRWGLLAACTGTGLTAVLLLPTLAVAYAWLGAMACGLWALWFCAHPGHRGRTFCGGLLAALALLYRQDLGPAVIASTLPLFLLMTPAARRAFLAGVALALLPLLVLAVAVGPREIWNNFFLYPVVLSSPGRRLPLSSAAPYLMRILCLHGAACLAAIAAGALAVRAERSSPQARLLLAVGLFSLGLTHQAMQRIDFVHVPYAAFISLGMLPAVLTVLAQRLGRGWPQGWSLAAGSLAALALVVGLGWNFVRYFGSEVKSQLTAELPGAFVIEGNGRKFYDRFPNSGYAAALMVKALTDNAKPGQRLFIGPRDLRRTNGNDTYLYHLLPQLVPATYFLEMNPHSANRPGSRLAADAASADWVLLNNMWDHWEEPNSSRLYGSPEPGDGIEAQFQMILRRGNWELFRRKSLAPPPRPAPERS